MRDKIITKLYVDLVGSIVYIFNHHLTFVLLLVCTIKKLIKKIKQISIILFILTKSIYYIIKVLFFLCCQCILRR